MFSGEQLKRLEEEFHRNQYLVGVERAELAARLGLSETQVIIYHLNLSSSLVGQMQELLYGDRAANNRFK